MARPRSVSSFDQLVEIVSWHGVVLGYVPHRGREWSDGVVRYRVMRWLWDTHGSSHFLAWAAEHISDEEWRRLKTRVRVARLRKAGGNQPSAEQRADKSKRARLERAVWMAYQCKVHGDPIYMLRRHIPLLLEHAPADLAAFVRQSADRLAEGDRLLASCLQPDRA